jgi:NAD(P)-dependent dehydrogenase (short-subunit alcohol dehydrogenase family)
MMMTSDPSDRVVLITGASGNLGKAVALAFLEAGARLALVERQLEKLEAAFSHLPANRRLLLGDVDMTADDSVARMVEAVIDAFGRVDVLVNTIGGFRAGADLDLAELEVWQAMLDLNAKTAYLACRHVVPHMRTQASGKIINIGARTALQGSPGAAAYSASKAAVLRLTESVSAEVKGLGINVNCVIPGTIDTPANRAARPQADTSQWVQPEALADVILFLASDSARAIHGAALPVFNLT